MAHKKIEIPEHIDLERFLSVQSHDLKTPFNHVIGFTRIVMKGQDGPLTDFQKEDLTTVYNSGLRTLAYMSGLVEMARINGGEKIADFEDTDVRKLVDESIAQWKKAFPMKNFAVEPTINCASATHKMDAGLIRQAVYCLMICVGEYVEGTAKITLEVKEEPGFLVFTFTSQGKKVPAPSVLDIEMHGYIARAYIDQHGGNIRIKQENDDGAAIAFDLPEK